MRKYGSGSGVWIGVVKRAFGCAELRYHGLNKNAHRLLVTCALTTCSSPAAICRAVNRRSAPHSPKSLAGRPDPTREPQAPCHLARQPTYNLDASIPLRPLIQTFLSSPARLRDLGALSVDDVRRAANFKDAPHYSNSLRVTEKSL